MNKDKDVKLEEVQNVNPNTVQNIDVAEMLKTLNLKLNEINTFQANNEKNEKELRERMEELKQTLQPQGNVTNTEFYISPDVSHMPIAPQYDKRAEYISKLLTPFKGHTDNFKIFKEKINLVMQTYNVEPDIMKLMVINKLEGNASKWFHSSPNFIKMNLDELLREMGKLFDTHKTKLEMKREFENRKWKTHESFFDYYQDKMVLANRLNYEEDELVEYLIDGMNNLSLQSQARMQMFDNPQKMLRAFENIRDDERGVKNTATFNSKSKFNMTKPKSSDSGPVNKSSDVKPIRCYNCGESGHISLKCEKPKRPIGSCIKCGQHGHKIDNCPDKKKTVLLCEKPKNSVNIELKLFMKPNEKCQNYLGLVDTGSAVSLIKENLVPTDIVKPYRKDDCQYLGINQSKLKILGSVNVNAIYDDVLYNFNFKIVPDCTMSNNILIGRDILSKLNAKIKISENEIVISNDDNFENEIFNICIDNNSEDFSYLNVNEKIDPETKLKLIETFDANYLNCEKPNEPNVKFEMNIVLAKNEVFNTVPRRLSFSERDIVANMLEDLLQKNFIRPSSSPYCSPIVLVNKKQKSEKRLCVDYRHLNKLTLKDNYPIPVIEDLLEYLEGKVYFSSLDLKNGFHHVVLAPDSIQYTSFVTPIGQFEYLRMPFGLKNGPSTFQRYIVMILKELIDKRQVIVYIDDILIATKSLEEHSEILTSVFKLLSSNLLELRIDKCKFMFTQIEYLGYLVDAEGISPSRDNIRSIIEFPYPKNMRELQRFLGMCSYFRKFIKDFCLIAAPLQKLVRKSATFEFGSEQVEAFEHLKQKLIEEPVLAIYSRNHETELHCDASSIGFGSVLLQKKDDCKWHPIFYFSKRTTPVEAKYHSYELECLAIVNALRRFRVYLLGKEFKIVTDCNALTLTLNKKLINPRIARWALELQEFDYTIEHRAGKRMQHVDALSRVESVLVLEENPFEQTLAMMQCQDKKLESLKSELEKKDSPLYELRDGLIYRKIHKNKIRFYVPDSMEQNVIKNCHDNMGHLGIEKTVEVICRNYWFPSLRDKVKLYVSNCLKCIMYNVPSGKVEGYLHSIPKGNKPFETIHVDFYGPLEPSRYKHKYILAVIDGFTKYVKLYPTKTTSTKETLDCLKTYFISYSRPVRIISDRGSNFTSSEFADFLKEKCIDHVKVATAAPRANGQVERINRTLTPMLAKLVDKENKVYWTDVLDQVEFAMNNTISKTTNTTPSMLLYGINQKGEVNDKIVEYLNNYVELDEEEEGIENLRQVAENNIVKSQLYNEGYYNKKRKDPHKYQKGDLIVIKNIDTTPGVNRKLIPKYRGPYVISEVLDNDRYCVKDVDGFQITNRPFEGIYDCTRIKPYMKSQ